MSGDPWDRAMQRLTMRELELLRAGYANGGERSFQAALKASLELGRREGRNKAGKPYGIGVGPESIGRRVGYWTRGRSEAEYGRITSYNEHFVFVRYGDSDTSAATRRDDLEWTE